MEKETRDVTEFTAKLDWKKWSIFDNTYVLDAPVEDIPPNSMIFVNPPEDDEKNKKLYVDSGIHAVGFTCDEIKFKCVVPPWKDVYVKIKVAFGTKAKLPWRYAGLEYDDVVNGDGVGAVLFVQGCSHQCEECHNPSTWDPEGGKPFTKGSYNSLRRYFRDVPFAKRLTFSGGDPVEHYQLVDYVIENIKNEFPNIVFWIYTGYTWEQLQTMENAFEVVKKCDVLVDGLYERDLRDVTLKYRGSSNQRIISIKRSISSGQLVLLK